MTSAARPPSRTAPWPGTAARLAPLAPFLGVGLAFAPVLAEWASYCARVSRLGYALLVPLLALVLAWARGPASGGAPARRLGSLLLLGAAGLLALGSLAGVFTISVAGFPLAILACAASRGGRVALGHQRAALAFLWLMVPVPLPLLDGMNPTLVEVSGRIALVFLRGLDADAAWVGSTLSFQRWDLVVADACSGSGTTLMLLALGAFLAGLFRLRPSLAAAMLVATVPLSLVVNGLRIAASALCLAWIGPSAATGLPHELLGQALVLGTSALLVFLGVRLGPAPRSAPRTPGEAGS